jgi:hypothetical protein
MILAVQIPLVPLLLLPFFLMLAHCQLAENRVLASGAETYDTGGDSLVVYSPEDVVEGMIGLSANNNRPMINQEIVVKLTSQRLKPAGAEVEQQCTSDISYSTKFHKPCPFQAVLV